MSSPRSQPGGVEPSTLRVEGLTVRFGGTVAVNEVSLEVEPGQVIGLIGPNGAGKTTLIDAVTGLVRARGGNDHHRRAGHHPMGHVPTGPGRPASLVPVARALRGPDRAREHHGGSRRGGARPRGSPISIWPRNRPLTPAAVAAVKEFQLTDRLGDLPPSLSNGERRLLAIARTVASGPPLLLLDEPAAGLDETQSRELGTLIRRLARERGMGILLVEHDVGMVMATCDRVVVIDFGSTIADGTPDEVRADERVIGAYLGERHKQAAEPA